jgi:protein-S-isoprenylcysteine O-methyltransferase Ste14
LVQSGPFFAHSDSLRILFWLTFGAWCGLEAWVFSRDRRPANGVSADRGSLRVLAGAIAASLFVAFAAASLLRGPRLPGASLLFPFGLLLAWSGILLRLWAVVTLGRFFRVAVTRHADHQLIQTGPYRRLRNPSYTGAMLTLVGVGLAIGNAVSLAVLIFGPLLGYLRRIQVEDAALAAQFGAEYQAYRRRSWALLPLVW